MIYYYIPIRKVKIKYCDNTNCYWVCGEGYHSYINAGFVKWYNHYGKRCLKFKHAATVQDSNCVPSEIRTMFKNIDENL